MKKISTVFFAFTLVAVALMSCEKQEVVPGPSSTSINFADLNNQYLDNKTQTFTVDANTFNVIYGNEGTRIQLSGNNFSDQNGNPLNGTVDIELIELYSFPAMIAANKATLGTQNGQISPLTSGGEFYVSVTQNGVPVNVVNPLTFRTAPTTSAVNNMQLFNGEVNGSGDIIWALDNPLNLPTDSSGSSYFFGWEGDYNWVNCDYFYASSSPQTSVTVSVPSYLNENETKAYVAVPSETILAQLSTTSSHEFGTGSSYSLPEGLDIYTIVLTVYQNKIRYSIQQSTIGTNHAVNVSTMEEVSSLEELEVALQPYF